MRPMRTIISTAVIGGITLTLGVLPAEGQPAKPEPRPAAPSASEARLQAVEAAASRAAQFAATRGALGAYYDSATAEHVVVTSRGANLSASEVALAVGAASRVEQRDISRGTIDSIQSTIAARSFHADAGNYSYASYFDAASGKVVVNSDAPSSVTEALSGQFGGTLDVRAGGPSDAFSRRADTPPFWGGASIKSGAGVCTAGFVVQKGGSRFMTTAGHCFALGANVLTTDGNLSMGTIVQRGPIPPFDMELIGGKSYGSSIYVGGTNSTTSKKVVAAADPAVGFVGYCFSGQTSGEKCNLKVDSVTAQVCTQTGCKSPVIQFSGGAPQGGDSGSPFYLPSGSNAHIRGMVIATNGTTGWAEKWSRISSNLGVSIVV